MHRALFLKLRCQNESASLVTFPITQETPFTGRRQIIYRFVYRFDQTAFFERINLNDGVTTGSA